MKKQPLTKIVPILLISVTIFAAFTIITTQIHKVSVINQEPTPRWTNVQYSISGAKNSWSIFNTDDLNYKISIPDNTTVTTGGAFSSKNPELEYKSFSFSIPTKNNNIAITIDTGDRRNMSAEEIDREYQPRVISFTKSKLAKYEAYMYSEKNPGSWEGNVYYVLGERLYYRIKVTQYNGTATAEEVKTIEKMLASFELNS